MATNQRLKPRPKQPYDNAKHGTGASQIPRGNFILNTELCRMTLQKPMWEGTPMVFRPWPEVNPADPSLFLPGRISTAVGGQSSWLTRVTSAQYIGPTDGENTASFLLYHPWQTEKQQRKVNPYWILYSACKDAAESKLAQFGPGRLWDAKWSWLLSGEQGKKTRGKPLPAPKSSWFIQGHVYANGTKQYVNDRGVPLGLDPADDLVVIELSSTCGTKLMQLLDVEKSDYSGDTEQFPWLRYHYGNATGVDNGTTIEGGLIITIFDPKSVKTITKNTSWDGGEVEGFRSYECALGLSYKDAAGNSYSPTMTEAEASRARNMCQFWYESAPGKKDGVLRVPSVDEQCLLIARAFEDYPKMLMYAWHEHPEFMTDEVTAVLNARRQASIPTEFDDAPQRLGITAVVEEADEFEDVPYTIVSSAVEHDYAGLSFNRLAQLAEAGDGGAQAELLGQCPAGVDADDYSWTDFAALLSNPVPAVDMTLADAYLQVVPASPAAVVLEDDDVFADTDQQISAVVATTVDVVVGAADAEETWTEEEATAGFEEDDVFGVDAVSTVAVVAAVTAEVDEFDVAPVETDTERTIRERMEDSRAKAAQRTSVEPIAKKSKVSKVTVKKVKKKTSK